METSRRLWRLETPEGAEVCKYALRGARGEWLGDVTLEYSAAQHQLEMHVISDFGNYGCRWDGAVPRWSRGCACVFGFAPRFARRRGSKWRIQGT